MKRLTLIFMIIFLFFIGGVSYLNLQNIYGHKHPPHTTEKDGVGYFTLYKDIKSEAFRIALLHFIENDINRVVIEIQTPGGNLYEVWRIVGLLEEYKNRIQFETRTYSIAFSGGFLLFIAVDKDKRFGSEFATFAWHTPGTYRNTEIAKAFIFEQTLDYITSRTNISAETIRLKTENNSIWWFNMREAIAMGVATGYIPIYR